MYIVVMGDAVLTNGRTVYQNSKLKTDLYVQVETNLSADCYLMSLSHINMWSLKVTFTILGNEYVFCRQYNCESSSLEKANTEKHIKHLSSIYQ